MDNKIKQEVDNIEIPDELHRRVIMGLEKVKNDNSNQLSNITNIKKKSSLRRKITYCCGTAVLLFLLFIGSAFVFPPIAVVASKIPYLNLIFQPNTVDVMIFDKLKERGYKINSTSIIYNPKKSIEVRVEGSDDYYNKIKSNIEQIVKEILYSKGYDSYTVKVIKEENNKGFNLSKEDSREKLTIENDLTNLLKQFDYQLGTVEVDPTDKLIFVSILGSNENYLKIKNEVEKTIIEYTKKNKYKGYKINITNENMNLVKVNKGAQITPTIAEKLMSKKKYKVTGVGFKENPLTFTVNTSILSTDPKAKDLGIVIEKIIVDTIKTEKIKSLIGNESYNIIINSKDRKKIN